MSDLENIENCLVRIIGIKKAKGKGYALNPKRNVVIENGDKIFILGQKEHTGLLRKKIWIGITFKCATLPSPSFLLYLMLT